MSIESQIQEYQLKLGILHYPTLKTIQLMHLLQSQINNFLRTELQQSVAKSSSQNFIASIESLNRFQDTQQYVGVVIIYNVASYDSFQYAKQCLYKLKNEQNDVFIILVQMQTGDKGDNKLNAIDDEGQILAEKQEVNYVKLTIQNCQDLINLINKNLYEIIQNYYYPNEENYGKKQSKDQNYQQYSFSPDKSSKKYTSMFYSKENHERQEKKFDNAYNKLNNYTKTQHGQISFNNAEDVRGQQLFKLVPQPNILHQTNKEQNRKKKERINNSQHQYRLQYSQQTARIPKTQKKNTQLQKQKATEFKQNRNRQILQRQRCMDQTIRNSQQALNSINGHYNRKIQSGRLKQLKNTLYSSCEKNSHAHGKLKVAQQLVDSTPKTKRTNFNLSKNIFQNRMVDANKIFNHKKADSQAVMTMLISFNQNCVLQYNLTQSTSTQELSKQIINQLGMKLTEKNIKIIENKVIKRIQMFTKQTQGAIRHFEQKRISDHSYVKSRNIF